MYIYGPMMYMRIANGYEEYFTLVTTVIVNIYNTVVVFCPIELHKGSILPNKCYAVHEAMQPLRLGQLKRRQHIHSQHSRAPVHPLVT